MFMELLLLLPNAPAQGRLQRTAWTSLATIYGSPDATVQGAQRQSIVKKRIDAREEGVGVYGYA